jgi:type I phosphodiesterase/nucleotide pyrophosphatase
MSCRMRAIYLLCSTLAVSVAGPRPFRMKPLTKTRSRVIVLGVNGMEWDIIRPLLIRGELPNLASVIKRGVYGKLRAVWSPNCPKVYSTIATSTAPEQKRNHWLHRGGITATPTC